MMVSNSTKARVEGTPRGLWLRPSVGWSGARSWVSRHPTRSFMQYNLLRSRKGSPQAPGDCQQRRGRAGRPHLHRVGPFLFREKGTQEEYKAGFDLAIERGWLELDRSGTFVRFTQAGSDLFA